MTHSLISKAVFRAGIALLLLGPVMLPVSAQETTSQAAPAFIVEGYRSKAEAGDTRAMVRLAVLYERGLIGGGPDMATAAVWYQRAAEGGHASAQFKRARMYAEGLGGPRDMTAAAALYRQAAEQGVAEAQYNLAILLQNGTGVEKSLPDAVHWYEQAAFRGIDPATRTLGLLYLSGVGQSAKDDIEAWAWLTLAAESGDEFSRGQAEQIAARLDAASQTEAQQLLDAYRQLRLTK